MIEKVIDIQDEIENLKANGASIMLSTHRMENVEAICDNVVLLNKSKVVTQGSVMDVRNSLKDNTYEIVYTGDIDPQSIRGISIQNTFETSGMNAFKFTYDQKTPDLQIFNNLPIELKEYREVIPSMQSVFLTLTDSNDD